MCPDMVNRKAVLLQGDNPVKKKDYRLGSSSTSKILIPFLTYRSSLFWRLSGVIEYTATRKGLKADFQTSFRRKEMLSLHLVSKMRLPVGLEPFRVHKYLKLTYTVMPWDTRVPTRVLWDTSRSPADSFPWCTSRILRYKRFSLKQPLVSAASANLGEYFHSQYSCSPRSGSIYFVLCCVLFCRYFEKFL